MLARARALVLFKFHIFSFYSPTTTSLPLLYHFHTTLQLAPFYPDIDGPFDPFNSLNEQDMDFLQENGFNVVRLYVAWPAVMPQRGQINTKYFDVSVNLLSLYL